MGSQYSNEGKIYIEGISQDTTKQRVRDCFEGYGEVREVILPRDYGTGQLKCYGFVIFSDPEIINAALEKNEHTINGKVINARRALLTRKQFEKLNNEGKRVFVGGLPHNLTEEEFHNRFQEFGHVVEATIRQNPKTKRPGGYGFITFDSKDTAEHVFSLRFLELKGTQVEVKRPTPISQGKSLNIVPADSDAGDYTGNYVGYYGYDPYAYNGPYDAYVLGAAPIVPFPGSSSGSGWLGNDIWPHGQNSLFSGSQGYNPYPTSSGGSGANPGYGPGGIGHFSAPMGQGHNIRGQWHAGNFFGPQGYGPVGIGHFSAPMGQGHNIRGQGHAGNFFGSQGYGPAGIGDISAPTAQWHNIRGQGHHGNSGGSEGSSRTSNFGFCG